MNNTPQLDDFKRLLAQRVGLRIAPDAHERFAGMLLERAARLSHATLEAYRIFLLGHEANDEWEEYARAFTSSETFFFRDQGQFDLLHLRLLPELIAQHRHDKTLRLWSAGCASGEEAYSLAMLTDMLLPELSDWNLLILGTDIDSRAIARARHGHYGQWSFRSVPAALQQRYFQQEENAWVLDERIRRMVTFRVANLVEETFPNDGSELHDMDLILCRNVFIYFDPAAVSAVAAKLAATLAEGGYLLTAHTELIGHPVPGLESRLFAEGVVHKRQSALPAPRSPAPHYALPPPLPTSHFLLPAPSLPHSPTQHVPVQAPNPVIALIASARDHADRGEYELAERMCREALATDALAAAPYFLLAQLAQIKGDFERAMECLNKAIYLDHLCVAAYLELAALHERAGDMPRALALRRGAWEIVRSMPADALIEQYETTAGELVQWLAQWEPSAHGNSERSPRGQ